MAEISRSVADTTELELRRVEQAYSRRPDKSHYSLFEPAVLLACQERERKFLGMLRRHGIVSLPSLRILEVGCGTGFWLREFVKWGAEPKNIYGIDLLSERVDEARTLCAPGVSVECGSASNLNFPAGAFDLILQSTMFTSILDWNMKAVIAREMLRVVSSTGSILWYDFRFNNPSNKEVRGIKGKEIKALFPGCRIDLLTLTLAPPIARPVARISTGLHNALSAIFPLRSHYLALIQQI